MRDLETEIKEGIMKKINDAVNLAIDDVNSLDPMVYSVNVRVAFSEKRVKEMSAYIRWMGESKSCEAYWTRQLMLPLYRGKND